MTFTYTTLGFPIELVDVPMRKILGEWVLDINLNILHQEVLKMLIHKPTPLQAGELRFIRKYFEMTTTAFGEVFGVSHAAVIKWKMDNYLLHLWMFIFVCMSWIIHNHCS